MALYSFDFAAVRLRPKRVPDSIRRRNGV